MSARTAIGLGLAFFAGGAMFGSPSLYPAGVALVVLALAATVWVRLASWQVRIERHPPAGPLVEQRTYPFGLQVQFGLLPPPGGELRDPLLEAPLPLRTTSRRRSFEPEIRFRRRGRHRLGAARLVLRDPFGLAERVISGDQAGDAVVLPRTEPIELTAAGAAGALLGRGERGAGSSGQDAMAVDSEVDGLRPYREGSPASRIHWPTVARTGELHERRITSGADAARLVILDPGRAAGEDELDAAVRAAASICLELGSRAACTLLIGGEPRPIEIGPGLRNFADAHHRLALVEAAAGAPALHRIGRAGTVFWISADRSRAPLKRLRRFPALRRVLVRPAAAGVAAAEAAPALFRVAGCEAIAVGAGARGRRAGAVR